MANEILDDVLGFSMRKDALELHLQVLCGNISQSTCDIIVYVNSDKRSQLPENERNESLIEKPSHQKGVKYIFHLNMKTGSNSYKWEEMICQCFKEANARECEDVAFDIDRAGEDPSKMATFFEKSMHTLEYSEYPSVSKVYVKGLQIYTANVFYYEMFTNYIVRMTWENRGGNGWYDNTASMESFKFDCHLDEDWRRLTKYEVLDYLPDDWAEMETKETHKLVTLDNSGYNNKDYIKECFDKDTSNKYRVIEIQRVQIPWLYKMHRMYLDTIEEEDDVSPRIEILWHGCSQEAATNISQSGFDMRHVGENGGEHLVGFLTILYTLILVIAKLCSVCFPEAAKNISQSGFDMRHVGENGGEHIVGFLTILYTLILVIAKLFVLCASWEQCELCIHLPFL